MKVTLTKQWLGHKPGKTMHISDGVANTLIKRRIARLADPEIETAMAQPAMERAVSRGNKRGK